MNSDLLFPKRIGRLSWLARTILATGIFLPAAVYIAPNSPIRPHIPPWIFETIGWVVVILFMGYAIAYIHLPRAKSLGLHGATLLFLFVPLANIFLFMMFLFAREGYWTRIKKLQASKYDTKVA